MRVSVSVRVSLTCWNRRRRTGGLWCGSRGRCGGGHSGGGPRRGGRRGRRGAVTRGGRFLPGRGRGRGSWRRGGSGSRRRWRGRLWAGGGLCGGRCAPGLLGGRGERGGSRRGRFSCSGDRGRGKGGLRVVRRRGRVLGGSRQGEGEGGEDPAQGHGAGGYHPQPLRAPSLAPSRRSLVCRVGVRTYQKATSPNPSRSPSRSETSR